MFEKFFKKDRPVYPQVVADMSSTLIIIEVSNPIYRKNDLLKILLDAKAYGFTDVLDRFAHPYPAAVYEDIDDVIERVKSRS